MRIRARDVIDVAGERLVHRLRCAPIIARAFAAGRMHAMRDKLMERARDLKSKRFIDADALGEVLRAARACNLKVVRFLQTVHEEVRVRRPGATVDVGQFVARRAVSLCEIVPVKDHERPLFWAGYVVEMRKICAEQIGHADTQAIFESLVRIYADGPSGGADGADGPDTPRPSLRIVR